MAYSARRGVNVSQYVANLNTVPAPDDLLNSPTNLDDDLALFTSNEFVDWDGSSGFNPNPTSFDMNFEQPTNPVATPSVSEPKMDFNLDSEYFSSTGALMFCALSPSSPLFPPLFQCFFRCSVMLVLQCPECFQINALPNQRSPRVAAHPASLAASHPVSPRSLAIHSVAHTVSERPTTRSWGTSPSS